MRCSARDGADSDRPPLESDVLAREVSILLEREVHSVDLTHTVGRQIIVKAGGSRAKAASGLFIPDNAKEKPQQGEVLAVGPAVATQGRAHPDGCQGRR